MSLKAKIEAVIYASEEPVTVVQLMGLLGVEAQADLDALEARQGSLLPLEEAGDEDASQEDLDPEALNAETLGTAADGDASPGAGIEAPPDIADGVVNAPASETQTAPTPTTDEKPSSTAQEMRKDDAQKRESRERERRLRDYFRSVLDRLTADYAEGDRGLEIREVAGGFRFATKPEFHDTVRGFVRSLKPPLKLSLQALETLAVVAYKQPVTAPEISEIRGVDSGGVLGSLIARKLITTAGRKQVIGRPILYKTTREFLLRFGLKDTGELPSIEEFEKMAGELAEAVQEEIDMEQSSGPNRSEETSDLGFVRDSDDSPAIDSPASSKSKAVEPMRDVHEAQADGVPDSTAEPGSDDNASHTADTSGE